MQTRARTHRELRLTFSFNFTRRPRRALSMRALAFLSHPALHALAPAIRKPPILLFSLLQAPFSRPSRSRIGTARKESAEKKKIRKSEFDKDKVSPLQRLMLQVQSREGEKNTHTHPSPLFLAYDKLALRYPPLSSSPSPTFSIRSLSLSPSYPRGQAGSSLPPSLGPCRSRARRRSKSNARAHYRRHRRPLANEGFAAAVARVYRERARVSR